MFLPEEEAEVREKLATAYRIMGHLGFDDHTYTHISAKPPNADYFFIYPFGLRFEEVTAENLLKVSLNGEVLSGSEWQYNRTGYIIHGNIYRARADINAIFHLHTETTVAVSSTREGLLPLSQWAMHFYNQVAYTDYNSLALDANEGDKLVADLGEKFVMLLKHHGSICCGRTIQEAMFYNYHLERATKTQIAILTMNPEPTIPPKEILEQTVKDLLSFEPNLGERDWQAWVRLDQRLKS